MNEEKLNLFSNLYTKFLEQAVKEHPEDYLDGAETNVSLVAGRMRVAFRRGTFNKDGRAIKATCKELGIKHTYKAISEYLERS